MVYAAHNIMLLDEHVENVDDIIKQILCMAIIKENLYLVKTVETGMPLVAQGPSDLELSENQKKILLFEKQLAVLQEEIKKFRLMFWPEPQPEPPSPISSSSSGDSAPASPTSSSSSDDSASTCDTDDEEQQLQQQQVDAMPRRRHRQPLLPIETTA
jgi:hypothetical protein